MEFPIFAIFPWPGPVSLSSHHFLNIILLFSVPQKESAKQMWAKKAGQCIIMLGTVFITMLRNANQESSVLTRWLKTLTHYDTHAHSPTHMSKSEVAF